MTNNPLNENNFNLNPEEKHEKNQLLWSHCLIHYSILFNITWKCKFNIWHFSNCLSKSNISMCVVNYQTSVTWQHLVNELNASVFKPLFSIWEIKKGFVFSWFSASVSSGLSLGQTSKRSHMHLSTSSLGNALSNVPPSLHYPVTPCHYSNQQATYGMMTGEQMRSKSVKLGFLVSKSAKTGKMYAVILHQFYPNAKMVNMLYNNSVRVVIL